MCPTTVSPCTQIKELEQKSFSLELRAKVRQLIIAKTFHVNIARTYATPQKIIWTVPVEARGLRSKHTALTKQFCDTPWISWLKVTSLAHKALLHQSNITTTSPLHRVLYILWFTYSKRDKTKVKLANWSWIINSCHRAGCSWNIDLYVRMPWSYDIHYFGASKEVMIIITLVWRSCWKKASD